MLYEGVGYLYTPVQIIFNNVEIKAVPAETSWGSARDLL